MQKVRFGVVGTNFISDWVIEGAREDPRFELVAVCSRSRERGGEFAARHSIAHVFTSLDEMASSPLIDAVYIASPNFMHAPQSILCMSRGKHVLCEKPLASNAREAREMIEASERYGVALMEAMKPTMTPHFKALADNLPRVGEVRRYFASYCQYSSRYDRFKAGELPNAFNPKMSNGAIMDIGVYTIYPMVEQGLISLDTINRMADITFTPRAVNLGGGKSVATVADTLSAKVSHNEYYYEVAEFISLVLEGRRQSEVNSHENSLITMEIIDEIRRQAGIVYPADQPET